MNVGVCWRDRLEAWHGRWCTPRRICILRWASMAGYGGALMLALWR